MIACASWQLPHDDSEIIGDYYLSSHKSACCTNWLMRDQSRSTQSAKFAEPWERLLCMICEVRRQMCNTAERFSSYVPSWPTLFSKAKWINHEAGRLFQFTGCNHHTFLPSRTVQMYWNFPWRRRCNSTPARLLKSEKSMNVCSQKLWWNAILKQYESEVL